MVGTGQTSQALIIVFKPEVRLLTHDLSAEVLTLVALELVASTLLMLSILLVSTVVFNAPSAAIYLAQRSFIMALNLQSPRRPLQPDFPLPVHQKGVGKESA